MISSSASCSLRIKIDTSRWRRCRRKTPTNTSRGNGDLCVAPAARVTDQALDPPSTVPSRSTRSRTAASAWLKPIRSAGRANETVINVILVFAGPELIRGEFVQHAGQERCRGDRRRCLPSPARVARGSLLHQSGEFAQRDDGFLERGEIVQVADDGGIVVVAATPPRMHPPSERAQLVGRCLDRIHAQEGRYLRRLLLCHADQRRDRPRNRW